MMLCLFLADHSRLYQAPYIRVVSRYSRNLPIADQVQPGVANVDVIKGVIVTLSIGSPDYGCRCTRRAHTPQLGMSKTVLADLLVRSLQTFDQSSLRVISPGVAIYRHQGFHPQAAGLLTTFVAAHAIGHDREPPLTQELLILFRFPIAKRIFVIGTHAPDVGLARYFNSGADVHSVTASLAGMSRAGIDCVHGQTQHYTGYREETQTGRRNQGSGGRQGRDRTETEAGTADLRLSP